MVWWRINAAMYKEYKPVHNQEEAESDRKEPPGDLIQFLPEKMRPLGFFVRPDQRQSQVAPTERHFQVQDRMNPPRRARMFHKPKWIQR